MEHMKQQQLRWYERKRTYIVAVCAAVLLYGVWVWRDWVGLGVNTEVQVNAAAAFQLALTASAAEATSYLHETYRGQTFYVPNYGGGSGAHDLQNFDSLFVFYLHQKSSMPLFRVTSITVVPAGTMDVQATIQYATWLGMTKTIVYNGSLPIPHQDTLPTAHKK